MELRPEEIVSGKCSAERTAIFCNGNGVVADVGSERMYIIYIAVIRNVAEQGRLCLDGDAVPPHFGNFERTARTGPGLQPPYCRMEYPQTVGAAFFAGTAQDLHKICTESALCLL